MADQSRSTFVVAGLQLSIREESHIIASPQNTPLLHQYPEWYTSTYQLGPNSVVYRNIESIHHNWGYWEFADPDHQAKAKTHGLDSPEEVFSATINVVMSSVRPFPSGVTSKSGHPIQWNDLEAINLIWIPGRLDGTKGLQNGQLASAYRHIREIQARRTRHSLPTIRIPYEKYVYAGTYFRWYLEPGADLQYIRQWINSTPLRFLSLAPSTAESIVAGFPEWKGRSLFGNSTNAIFLHDLYLHAADRRLKPNSFPMNRPPSQDGHKADTEDFTSYHPAVEDVTEKDFEKVCLALNQIRKGDYVTRGWDRPPVILDADGNVLRDPEGSGAMILDYPHLPMRISSCQGWWQRETWMRLDCRLVPDDLTMRKRGGGNKPRKSAQDDLSLTRPQRQTGSRTVKPAQARDRVTKQASCTGPVIDPAEQDGKIMDEVTEALKRHTQKKPRPKKHRLNSGSQSPPLIEKSLREDESEGSSSSMKLFKTAGLPNGTGSAMAGDASPNAASEIGWSVRPSHSNSLSGPTILDTYLAGNSKGDMFHPSQLGLAPSLMYPSLNTTETFAPTYRTPEYEENYSARRDFVPQSTSTMLHNAGGMSSNGSKPPHIGTDDSSDEQPTIIARARYEDDQPSKIGGTPLGYMKTPSSSSRWTHVTRTNSTASPDQGRIPLAYQQFPDPHTYMGYQQRQDTLWAHYRSGVEPLLSIPYVPTSSISVSDPVRPPWSLSENDAQDVQFNQLYQPGSYGTSEKEPSHSLVNVGEAQSRGQAQFRHFAPTNTMEGSLCDASEENQGKMDYPVEALFATERNPGSSSAALMRQQVPATGANITGAKQLSVGMLPASAAASSSDKGAMSNFVQERSGISKGNGTFVFDDDIAKIQKYLKSGAQAVNPYIKDPADSSSNFPGENRHGPNASTPALELKEGSESSEQEPQIRNKDLWEPREEKTEEDESSVVQITAATTEAPGVPTENPTRVADERARERKAIEAESQAGEERRFRF
ncbi:MAG: hypothetical protein Q9157_004369 [Trypethelium eluteriae]